MTSALASPDSTRRAFLAATGLAAGSMLAGSSAMGDDAPWGALADSIVEGEASFTPSDQESTVGELFRMTAETFAWKMVRRNHATDRYERFDVTFPSRMETPHPENNTVHAEYFKPKREGRRPGVVMLHILGGDFALSRLVCCALAQFGTAGLFVKLPYYGPRRPPGVDRRMVMLDAEKTIEGFTQAVLDVRRAVSVLAAQDHIDPEQLGVTGISLGGITATLSASNEPRLRNVAPMLAGGDLVRIARESKEFVRQRARIADAGVDPTEQLEKCRVIDPIRYAGNLKGRNVLMLNAKEDEVIPKACTLALWEAAGKPPIVWMPGGHYTAIFSLPQALMRVGKFFER